MLKRTNRERTKRLTFPLTAILMTVFALVAAACVDVNVTNTADLRARVRITLPDTPAGYTRLVPPGGTTSTFSEFGGTVTVTVLPDEDYRDLLLELRVAIGRKLLEDSETLSGSDVVNLVERLVEVNGQLRDLAGDGASCSVDAPDFSTVTVVLSWDLTTSTWSLSCSAVAESS